MIVTNNYFAIIVKLGLQRITSPVCIPNFIRWDLGSEFKPRRITVSELQKQKQEQNSG